MGANSCDYFLFTPGAFDWETFPKFIVGNVAYDQVRFNFNSILIRFQFDLIAIFVTRQFWAMRGGRAWR